MASDRVGYLGPEGSFTHEAVTTLKNVDAVAYPSLEDLLGAVADATLDQGLVPIENALEGTVSATIDGLAKGLEVPVSTVRAAAAESTGLHYYDEPPAGAQAHG